MSNTVLMEIITPEEMFYSAQVEMLRVKTLSGEEGFMANHVWCYKLLPEDGRVKFVEVDDAGNRTTRFAKLLGGYAAIKQDFVVYTDKAEWIEE